jgi:hypothetical protein
MFFDPMYFLFILPPLLLSLWASARVKSVFQEYARVATRRGMSGSDAARYVLDGRRED